jgi:hypothetical protein
VNPAHGGRVVVDVEGLGDAVWELLGKPRPRRDWWLYDKHGHERQELTRVLLVAVERAEFTFAAGLAEEPAMRKALVSLTRNVREDGPGSELAVALSLALDDHRPPASATEGCVPRRSARKDWPAADASPLSGWLGRGCGGARPSHS